MTKTTNYQLPQWGAEDPIYREDFNEAMASVDEGLNEAQEAAEAAQGTADAAMTAAETLPYVIGTYTGNGVDHGDTLVVNIGFKPRILIITVQTETLQDSGVKGVVVAGRNNFTSMIAYHDDGFSVTHISITPGTTPNYPRLNTQGKDYTYIAFR